MTAKMKNDGWSHQCSRGTPEAADPSKQQLGAKTRLVQRAMRKFTVVWPLVVCLLLSALTHAETAVQAWVQRYSARPYGYDATQTDAAIDSSNNVIVTGYWTYPSG
jgi:hypothetical protein